MNRIALLILIMGTSTAAAVEKPLYFLDGNQLHDMCKSNSRLVSGYVMGFSDAVSVTDEIGKKISICAPPSVKSGQLVDVVCRELDSHPESRHRNASYIVLQALQHAWPCGNQ